MTRNVYWSHTSVCLCACLSVAAFPHCCTDVDNLGTPLVVHYWADLQSVHWFLCYHNIAQTRNVNEWLYSLYAWFWVVCGSSWWLLPGNTYAIHMHSAVCAQSVYQSLTRQYFIEMAEWLQLVFSTDATLATSYIVLSGNSVISKNNSTSGTISQTLSLADFSDFLPWHIDRCQVSSTMVTLSYLAPTFVHNTLAMTQSVAWFICRNRFAFDKVRGKSSVAPCRMTPTAVYLFKLSY